MENNIFNENRVRFLREANALLQNNRFHEALNLAAERLQHYPADTDGLGIYGEALVGLGRLEELQELLHDVDQLISGLNLMYERTGDACRERGYYRDAAYCYEKFISLRPEAEKSREIIEKMTFLEQADQSSSGDYVAKDQNVSEQEFYTVTMAQLYMEQGHYHDAEIILKEIIKKEPLQAQAKAMLDELGCLQVPKMPEKDQSTQNGTLIKTLHAWLKNIERLKMNAAEK